MLIPNPLMCSVLEDRWVIPCPAFQALGRPFQHEVIVDPETQEPTRTFLICEIVGRDPMILNFCPMCGSTVRLPHLSSETA